MADGTFAPSKQAGSLIDQSPARFSSWSWRLVIGHVGSFEEYVKRTKYDL